ncbi:MAG TPA: serine/threonine-protein kinase [Pirellulales bacterium]|nr:serine/threonine-protein kinase [Pirellulales bacterium]
MSEVISVSQETSARPNHDGSETIAFVGESFSKEERDVAFVSQGLRAGLFGERQLKTALADWSIYGEVPVADHLQTLALVSPDDRARLEAEAAVVLHTLRTKQDVGGGKSTLGAVLENIDESGRIAALLGVGVALGQGQAGVRSSVGRLTLIRKLGQGGLGTVWLARDENMQRYVALKEVTRAHEASAPAIARFRREAEIAGRLEHPGIVPVYEFGEDTESSRVFYTMRFLGKQTLQHAVLEYHERREAGDHDPMLLRNLLTSFVSICQAIGHAHSRKVIHRDLKPENVAIDHFGQVIVIDWGLAKVLDETITSDDFFYASSESSVDAAGSQQTAAGQVLGTPLYMAPEQAAGRADEIDERTDIYGLGAILYAILTGIAPHERSQAESAASGARGLISAIAGHPTPLAREANPQADPALEAICAKAMAKRPYARYQSATELADEIQHWMAGEPVRAYRESRRQRLGRWVRQHRRASQLMGSALTVTLVAAVMLAASSYKDMVAKRTSKFEDMKGEVREIAAQFTTRFENLARNVRFMSNVPSVEGIITARETTGESALGNDEETWRTRLETNYEGLLRANQDYLAVALLTVKEGTTREIVRVERQITDPAFIRRVPKSRLEERRNDTFFEAVSDLAPGEVRLVIAEPSADGAGLRASRPRVLAAVPVYNEASGELFGLATIETDMVADAEGILEGFAGREAEVFVTNSSGQIWATTRSGRAAGSSNVAAIVPSVKEFFAANGAATAFVDASHGVVADRIRLNPYDSMGSIGLVLRLVD